MSGACQAATVDPPAHLVLVNGAKVPCKPSHFRVQQRAAPTNSACLQHNEAARRGTEEVNAEKVNAEGC